MNEFQRVDKKAKTAWTITRLIVMAVISGGLAAFLVPLALDGDAVEKFLFLAPLAVVTLLLLLNALIYPQIEYRQWTYRITDDKIEIKKGIIWRKYTVLPVARIQHVESANGVIQRALGLATVKIFTAGGMHRIENLSSVTAEEICSLLEKQVTKKIRAKERAEVKTDA